MNLVKEKFSEFQVSLEVSCFADEIALQSSISTNPVRVALDFADINTLLGSPEEEVEYSLLISSDDMMLTNWVDFQNTYHQVPNSVPEAFLQLFTPLQRFFNNIIKEFKTSKSDVRNVNYRQFPNLDYAMDTRLDVCILLTLYGIIAVEFINNPSHLLCACHLIPHDYNQQSFIRRAKLTSPRSSSHYRPE